MRNALWIALRAIVASGSWILWSSVPVAAGEAKSAIDFNRDIRPLLSRHCLACHGQDEASREGSLQLDDRESATAEADSGEIAVVPGEPERSELVARVTTEDEDMRMPPPESGERLAAQEIALLER